MDSSAATTGPLVVLGVAVLGLVALAVAAVRLRRTGRAAAGTAASAPGAAPQRTVVDDLPDFHARPPGASGARAEDDAAAPVALAPAAPARAVPPTTTAGAAAPSRGVDGPGAVRLVLAMAALALLLVGAAAAVALRAGSSATASARSGAREAAPPSAAVVPALPAVPDSPGAGQPGAGGLAWTSLPLGPRDTATRLAFGGLVLERQAVGITATYPGLSLTTHGGQALVHVRLPTFNCLSADAPTDPAAAGCVASVTEYADLPTPALRMSHDGTSVVLQGRFPTYTRPNGSAPEYTGRVYDLTVTVTPGRRLGAGRYVAEGVLTLGSGTARTDGDPLLDLLIRGR